MDTAAWWAVVPGIANSWSQWSVCTCTHTHTHTHTPMIQIVGHNGACARVHTHTHTHTPTIQILLLFHFTNEEMKTRRGQEINMTIGEALILSCHDLILPILIVCISLPFSFGSCLYSQFENLRKQLAVTEIQILSYCRLAPVL